MHGHDLWKAYKLVLMHMVLKTVHVKMTTTTN